MLTEQTSQTRPAAGAGMDRRVVRKVEPWWRRRATIAGIVAVIAFSLIWRAIPATSSTDLQSGDIETGTVSRAPFDDYLPLRATVEPGLTTLVGVLSGGQVEKLLVQDGSQITRGQPLATLANPSLKLDVNTREAQIAAQLGDASGQELGLERNRIDRSGQIAQANYDLIKARRELAIRQQLHDEGIVADAAMKSVIEEEQYQHKRLAQLQTGQARESAITQAQEARIADSRNRLANNLGAVEQSLDALIIRAPDSGRLTNFTIQPGQLLKAGDPAGQVDSEGSWKLTGDVDEYYLGRVAVGQKATADGGSQLTVTKVLPAVTSGRFRIELVFDGNAPARLNRGQAVDIRITLGASSRAIVAPIGGWLDSGGGSSVFVIDADGAHARRRALKTGRRNPEEVEILSGLHPGDRIITSSTASIRGDIINLH